MTMRQQFNKDLEKAKTAEKLALEVFTSLATGYSFEDVSNDRQHWHDGDIKATNLTTGKVTFLEIKDDSRIAETQNVLCEEENYYKECDYFGKGSMHYNYQIYCVVSQAERKIYIIDFSVLKSIYKKVGEFKLIKHAAQDSYVYLVPISRLKEAGGMIDIIKY